jgi:CRP-like cAMP-binding protein
LFEQLSETEIQDVLASARRRRFSRGDVIFHEGDTGDTLYLIAAGRVALRVTTPMGDTATLRLLGPGSYFGELAVVVPAPRNATVVALEGVETLGLHTEVIAELRSRNPSVDAAFLGVLVTEVRRLSTQLVDALYLPAAARVARRLVELAGLYGGVDPVVIPLTQEDIAGLCGTTRPTTNGILMDLQEHGVLSLARSRVTILDLERLRVVAD